VGFVYLRSPPAYGVGGSERGEGNGEIESRGRQLRSGWAASRRLPIPCSRLEDSGYFGSFTFSYLSNATLTILPSTFSTLRM
jgi:hypothetical protein